MTCSYLTITRDFDCFQYFNFETEFSENKHLFSKNYPFLAENTKIQNATFPYKNTLSEANAKTKRMVCTNRMGRQVECAVQNGPITKNRILRVTTLFFWKFCFNIRTSSGRVDLMCRLPKCPYPHFSCFSFIWGCFFRMSMLNFKQIYYTYLIFAQMALKGYLCAGSFTSWCKFADHYIIDQKIALYVRNS